MKKTCEGNASWILPLLTSLFWVLGSGFWVPCSADTGRRRSPFDPRNCGLLKTLFPDVGPVLCCDFSPDGRLLAVAGQKGKIRLYRTHDWSVARELEGHEGGTLSVSFSPDGRRVVSTGADRRARVIDVSNGTRIATFTGHVDSVASAAWRPDGKAVATASADQTVRIWDPATGTNSFVLSHASEVFRCLFSQEGSRLVTAAQDGKIRVWDSTQGVLQRTLVGSERALASIALSRDGRRLFTADADGAASIREWDWNVGRSIQVSRESHKGGAIGLCLTPDERYVISVADQSVYLWESSSLRLLTILNHHTQDVRGVAVSPGARWIATVGGDLQLKIWGYRPGGMARIRPKGFLGIRVEDTTDGVRVIEVLAGTAAERAGIRIGDGIRKVGGQAVSTSSESIAAIGSFFEGDEVEFVLSRAGTELTIRTKLGKRPDK